MRPELEHVLADAREALSPTGSDQERVRSRIKLALRAGAVPVGAGAGAGEDPSARPETHHPRSQRASGATPGRRSGAPGTLWTRGLVGGAVVAAFTGAAGYWMGHHAASRDSARPITPIVTPVRAPVSDSGNRPDPHAIEHAPRSGAPASPEVPAPLLPAPGKPRGRTVQPAGASGGGTAARNTAEERLDAEVRALRGVERALRDQQPHLALALLRELDAAVPKARLVEEREAMSTIARCLARTVPFGLDLAHDFRERHHNSVYLKRVEQACPAERSDDDRDR